MAGALIKLSAGRDNIKSEIYSRNISSYQKSSLGSAYCILLFTFLFCTTSVFPQRYSIHSYAIGEGVQNNYVHDVKQDSRGRMWFATETCISVYDGFKWINYTEADGLAKAQYYYLAIDKNDVVWGVPLDVASPAHYYKEGKWYKAVNTPKPIFEFEHVLCVDFVTEGGIQYPCYGAERGLMINRNGSWEIVTEKEGLIGRAVRDVAGVGEKIYAATASGISVYANGKIDNSINDKIKAPNRNIYAIDYEPATGRLWMWGEGWLGELNGDKFNLLVKSNDLKQIVFQTKHNYLLFDKKNKLFFGNEYYSLGYRLDLKELQHLGTQRGFSSAGNTSAFVDREGNLWFSHLRGIDKIENRRFQNFYRTEGLLEDEVSAILYLSPGRMVFGHNFGLSILENGEFKTIPFSRGDVKFRSASRVMDICRDSNGTIWFAVSVRGIGKLVNGNVEWIDNIAGMQVLSIMCGSDGKLWAAGDDGLYAIEKGRMRKIYIESESFGNFKNILEGDDNSIIMVKTLGLEIYKEGKVFHKRFAGVYDGKTLLSIYNFKKGTLLAGTNDGLFLFENDKFTPYITEGLNLNGLKVYSINKDSRNNLWFGTNHGVYKWDGKRLANYNLEAGLAGREANRNAFAEDELGRLWFGTDAGLSRYEANYDSEYSTPLPIFYSFEDEEGNKFPLDREISLASTHRSLVFSFNAVSFVSEKNIRFRVLLSGFDRGWVEIGGNRSIRYTSVPPGNYRFLVQARNLDGDWSPTLESADITISQPFYNQIWFVLLVIMLSGSAIYFTIIIIARFKYSRLLEVEVNERTKELAESEDKLRSIQKIARVGYIDWNMETDEMIWSDEVYIILGYSRENFKPSFEALTRLIPPEERKERLEKFFSYTKAQSEFDNEVVMLKTSGKPIWVRFVGKNYFDDNGRNTRMLTAILDITRLKKAQTMLKEYSELLNKTNSAKDKLFSVIAHDLKSPFLGILGIVRMAVEDFDSHNKEEFRSYFIMLNESLDKQFRLLNNLLNWAKLQMGKLKIEKGPVIVYDEITTILRYIDADAKSKNVLLVNSSDRNKVVFTDGELFGSTLQNLIAAAVKIAPDGERIIVTTDEKENFETITISCSCTVVPSIEIEQFFEEEAIHTKGPQGDARGMGLSLVLSRELIESMEGKLEISNAGVNGCSLVISLPKSEPGE